MKTQKAVAKYRKIEFLFCRKPWQGMSYLEAKDQLLTKEKI